MDSTASQKTVRLIYSPHVFIFFKIVLSGSKSVHLVLFLNVAVVVAKRNDTNPVTLTCRTEAPGAITWKFQGEEPEDVQQNGPHLGLSEVGTPILGEYSCWRGKEMLSSTHLLLEAKKEVSDSLSIICWAKSYDCNFSCECTHSEQTAVRFGLGHDCSEGRKSCHWISADQLVDGRFHLELSHSLSPYAEESTMLEVTAEAIVHLSVLRKTKKFYLRDIVQPDSPQIVMCQEGEEDLNVTIEPPSSWSTPHSFFSLEHEIQYVLKDNGKLGHSSSVLLPKGISKLRARSRDSLVLSHWSQWTPWKNVRRGNLCKCKNTAKSCCPELPSGYLDNCKKKQKKKRKKDAKQSQATYKECAQ
ncbi:interleukin-12 subunit beta isoform X1 [Anarrhichthys ocellatus]|uniref:interleukin-12 subunit beta isoform X1 n=1 Tax=Anarrhichthys ocellatus TaxID=433405 RepID=UPI0012EDF66C|nr:interleukin-12 subunit beta-like isoform X1 [Anarrhichthys ocellatus]